MSALKKPFKAPRKVRKQKEQARQSESDEDSIPFSELKEKITAEREVVWRELTTGVQDKTIRLLTEREADEMARFGEVLTWSDDENCTNVSMADVAESLKETPRTSSK